MEPFFLKVSFAHPHSPYDPPERIWRRYADADLPAAHVGAWAGKYRPRSGERDDIWHGDMGPQQVRWSRQGYYGSVTFVDEQIGRIMELLEKRGFLDQTLIVFTSDHGETIWYCFRDFDFICFAKAYEVERALVKLEAG